MSYFISINIVSFGMMFFDKKSAIKKKYRVPESLLLCLSLFGGCFGMFFGMYLFHHKTKKLKFKLVHLFCIMWVVGFIICKKGLV